MNDWAPLLVALFFGVLFILVTAFGLRLVLQVKASLTKLEKRIAGLESRLASQQASIAELKAQLEHEKDDPLLKVVSTALDWKSRGTWTTAGLVGAQLFRSYWKSRKPKALPAKKEK